TSTPLTETSLTDRLLIESSTLEISIPDFAAGRIPRHPNLSGPFYRDRTPGMGARIRQTFR
ncbi:MAG: hypothetical protein VYE53_10180, partial [Planctomycetota bacterium]|nr:hypothetical protein [Planctomycetota bacterium]